MVTMPTNGTYLRFEPKMTLQDTLVVTTPVMHAGLFCFAYPYVGATVVATG